MASTTLHISSASCWMMQIISCISPNKLPQRPTTTQMCVYSATYDDGVFVVRFVPTQQGAGAEGHGG